MKTDEKYISIDLSIYFNHKLLLPKEELLPCSEENGLDGIFIDNSNFINGTAEYDGIPFKINITGKDNITCTEQKIYINRNAKSIFLLGLMYWGSNICKYKIKYKSGEEIFSNIYFSDWTGNGFDGALNAYGINAKTRLFKSQAFGKVNHAKYFTMYKIKIENDCEIEYIELPDYYLMHLFAITLEL